MEVIRSSADSDPHVLLTPSLTCDFPIPGQPHASAVALGTAWFTVTHCHDYMIHTTLQSCRATVNNSRSRFCGGKNVRHSPWLATPWHGVAWPGTKQTLKLPTAANKFCSSSLAAMAACPHRMRHCFEPFHYTRHDTTNTTRCNITYQSMAATEAGKERESRGEKRDRVWGVDPRVY